MKNYSHLKIVNDTKARTDFKIAILISGCTVIVGLFPLNIYLLWQKAIDSAKLDNRESWKNLTEIADTLKTNILDFQDPKPNDIIDLCGHFKYLFYEKKINYYYLKSKFGNPCYSTEVTDDELKKLFKNSFINNKPYLVSKEEHPFPNGPYIVHSIMREDLLMQFGKSEINGAKTFKSFLKSQQFYDQLIFSLGVGFVFLFFSASFSYYVYKCLMLIKVQTSDKIDVGLNKIPLRFLKMFKLTRDSTSAYVESVLAYSKKQKEELNLYKTSLPHYLEKALLNGEITLPYAFRGVLVVADLNKFSRTQVSTALYNEVTEYLTKLTKKFRARYNGAFPANQGDSVVAVFQGKRSHQRGFDFIRDIINEFSKKEFYLDGKEIFFTFKAAIQEVDLEYKKVIDAFELTGTDRIIMANYLKETTFEEKIENRIAFSAADLIHYENLIDPKNIVFNSNGIIKINGAKDIREASILDLGLIENFYSDDSVVFMLSEIKTTTEIEKIKTIVACLHSVELLESNKEISEMLSQSLLRLKELSIQDSKWTKCYTQLLSSAGRLLGENSFKNLKGIELLKAHSDTMDPRIAFSIAEILNEMGFPNVAINLFKNKFSPFEKTESPRLQGELSRSELMMLLSNKKLKTLISLLKNKSTQNTGIYYTWKIMSYYKLENPSVLLIFSNYYKILGIASKINIEDLDQRMNTMLKEIFTIHSEVTSQKFI